MKNFLLTILCFLSIHFFGSNGIGIEKEILKSKNFEFKKYKNGKYFFKILNQQGVSVNKFQIQH
jgi:hypothetical protein